MLPLIMAGLSLLQNQQKKSADEKKQRVAAQMGEMPSSETTEKSGGAAGLAGVASAVAPLVSGTPEGGMGTGGANGVGAVDGALKSFDKHSAGLNPEDEDTKDYSSFL